MVTQPPTIYLIAGCNAAGKTTFAKEFLPKEVNCLLFLNADEIARGLSPLKQRVPQGGHHVPAADIRRRFKRSLVHLLGDYLPWRRAGRFGTAAACPRNGSPFPV